MNKSVARHVAASRSKNVAATGHANTKSLKSVGDRSSASMSGYKGGRSTYLESNNSAYSQMKRTPDRPQPSSLPPTDFNPNKPYMSGYYSSQAHISARGDVNPFRADTEYARMIR